MLEAAVAALSLFTALACAVVGGVMFAFSTIVMPALARSPTAEGVAAMQAINAGALRWPFMTLFFGALILAFGSAATAIITWDMPGAELRLAGGCLYVVGCFALTAGYHVPRNTALARLDPTDPAGASTWERFVSEWTRWNHVRAAAGVGAAAMLIAGV